jgi:hypothetical protein
VHESLGQYRDRVEIFWQAEMETSAVLVKIRFLLEEIFDQTPGPNAGKSV